MTCTSPHCHRLPPGGPAAWRCTSCAACRTWTPFATGSAIRPTRHCARRSRRGTPPRLLAFTLGDIAGQRVAYVGALQGLRSPDALEIYRQLTHQLHGLRPRDLLLTAFRRFGLALEVTRILAVDDSHRVSSNGYFAASGQVLSSYDEIWTESGGIATSGGFFELGPVTGRRESSAVPARKRALYRRRYEMLDALDGQIDASVAADAAYREMASPS